jgi:glycosyltransferase involved in cell wall biosynthesis
VTAPRILFVAPDHDEPSGGIRGIYATVDHLNAAGIPSAVVHEQYGFRCTWFTSDTRVVWAEDVNAVPGRDLLVLPEVYGPRIAHIGPGIAKAVFNRNTYNTFAGYPLVPEPGRPTAYEHPDVIAAVCVSDDNVEYLRYAFPRLQVHRTINPVDPALFHPEPKQPLLTFMPRKNARDAQQVLHLLAARGALQGVEVVPLHGMTQEGVAAAQRRALAFLSFGHPEGWGRPPAEAMACGTVVVGYHGMGGREYLHADHAFPIVPGDVVGFARAVEHVLHLWRTDPAALAAIGAAGAAAVTAVYTPEAERDSVVRVFGELLERVAPGALATLR